VSVLRLAENVQSPSAATTGKSLALLGTGLVGSAFLARLSRLRADGAAKNLRLVHAANSRRCISDRAGLAPANARTRLDDGECQQIEAVGTALPASGIIVDATASEDVAAWHPRWLAAGFSVVTANKAGTGGELARYRAIQAHASRYGDAATVGAGLPLLRSLRELRAGGDRILGLAGVLSGSLAWLFNHYDGMRPFSVLVREARQRGYTEPDPRLDLSGQDVKRKLLILARNAGHSLDAEAVTVESLLPEALVRAAADEVDAALAALDEPLRERFREAHRIGRRLRFVARLDREGRARIGLESLLPEDPLASGSGCDNRLAIWSDRYSDGPLVIQGPGAGAEVTAAALLDDVFRLAKTAD